MITRKYLEEQEMDDIQMLETADALKALRDEKNELQEQMKALQERID